jgi:lipoyl(octanoyl) transferase
LTPVMMCCTVHDVTIETLHDVIDGAADSGCAADRPCLDVRWLGRVSYREAAALQERLVGARRRGEAGDTLLLLEHPPVITLGRAADATHVLLPGAELARRGIGCERTGRGGDVTYHGPGQLVGYPILALGPGRRDARRYLRDLEAALILAVADLGVAAHRVPGLTGVWVGRDKLAAIGVRLSAGWITSHGFALNVSTDLGGFAAIVPCGLHDRGVTSLERLTGRRPALATVAAIVARRLGEVFDLDPRSGRQG